MNMLAKTQESLQVQKVDDASAVMSMIARAASDPNVDIDKMERLMQMQERTLERQGQQAYAEAMREVQALMPDVVKNAYNPQTKSKYANLEAITSVAKPIYTKAGFSLSFNTGASTKDGHIMVLCDVLHCDGHSKSFQYESPIDDAGIAGSKNKTATHGGSSAVSYAQRYLTKMIFNITLADEDNDGNGASGKRFISEEQALKINEWIESVSADKAKFLVWLQVGTVETIIAKDYDKAINALRAKEKK